MPIARSNSFTPVAPNNAPVSAHAPAPVQAPDYTVNDDEFRRLATIRFRHNDAIRRHTSALGDARDALIDALRALDDTERAAHAEMDAALPLRPRLATNDNRLGVETILPDPDTARDAFQAINRFVANLYDRIDAIDHSYPIHMSLVPR